MFIFKNSSRSLLAGNINAGATELAVAGGHGDRFPLPGYGEQFAIVVQHLVTGEREIMYVTERDADTFTVVRGQEGSVSIDLPANSTVAHVVTAGCMDAAISGGGGADDQTAAEVPYDNGASGLAATDVQAAIDEVVAEGGGGASFPLLAPNGDQLNPQYSFELAPGIGIFSDGTNLIITCDGVIKAYFNAETLQLNNDADNEASPPLLVTPNEDFGAQVIIGGKLYVGAHALGGGVDVAGLSIAHGPVPTDLEDGDMWTTAAGAFVRINGVTKQFTLT